MTYAHRRPRTASSRPRGRLLGAMTAAALAACALGAAPQTAHAATARQVERLDRGLVSVHTSGGNLVSWRWLATDANDVTFNVYRGSTKLTASPSPPRPTTSTPGPPTRPTTRCARW